MQAEKKDVGADYKKKARIHCDILFKVKINGKSKLREEIPLHMSLKVFNNTKEFTVKEVEKLIKKLNLKAPDTNTAKFKPSIFHSEHTDTDYYMLFIENIGDEYKKFYEHFGERGITHKKFMAHITINKEIYDKIKKDGLKPEDIEFSPLTIEDGANNSVRVFEETLSKSEQLDKGIKHVATALGVVGAMAGAPKQTAPKPQAAPKAQVQQPQQNMYSRRKMLNTIAQVESSGGKQTKHKELGGINQGESAYGKYALTPNTIRETIHMNPDLRNKYGKGMSLKGQDLQNYMKDNPGLEDTVADKHLQRLEHHFGQDPSKLGYAWLEGIHGTYNADKQKKDINNHWHVVKIRDAYGKQK